jgi:hypothetical protein
MLRMNNGTELVYQALQQFCEGHAAVLAGTAHKDQPHQFAVDAVAVPHGTDTVPTEKPAET